MKLDELNQIVSGKHPNFEANNNLIAQLALEEVSPDTLIDYAHSINEGMAKNVRLLIDKSLSREQIEKQNNTSKHWNAVRERLDNETFPDGFLVKLHELFDVLRNLRNTQGDTTHGHVGPKKYCELHLARFLLDLSISHARYVLTVANSLDAEKRTYLLEDDHPDKASIIEFHTMLDKKGRKLGGMNYSEQIYHRDYILYLDELERFENGVGSSLKNTKADNEYSD